MDQWMFRRVQEMRHMARPGNRDGFLRGVLAPRGGGNNAVNVQAIVQQLIDQEIQGKSDHHASRINVDGDVISYAEVGFGKVGVYLHGKPLTPENNYFEVEILDVGTRGDIAVGIVPKVYPLDRHPGWNTDSIAYHADDGRLYKAKGHGRPFGQPCDVGDRMGCGIKFEQVKDDAAALRHVVPVFFTKNGKEIGTVLAPMPVSGLYPAVGLRSENEEVRLLTDMTWESHGDVSMSVDNLDEEWSRLHDVRVNGQLLEYTGCGKSIADVGLAQARHALSTRSHYFELEIMDQGESCYIAIGVARKDYPRYRHPGWNKGSVAYHADDGKIFLGSGVGDPFGPKCSKGDLMGCGILYPRDYHEKLHGAAADAATSGAEAAAAAHGDSDGTRDSDASDNESLTALDGAAGVDPDLELDMFSDGSDSDEDEFLGFMQRHRAEPKGPKVKVFFTRNGKMIGHREAVLPPGGFYPTVGMLSSDEKVRVDLHPLTG